jgi:hypothetical protein
MANENVQTASAVLGEDRFWSRPFESSSDYIAVLRRFHEITKPRTYFEIGVDRGRTLGLAQCASIAIDPKFRVERPVMDNKPSCFFFKSNSDDFFRENDPTKLFGRPIDLAFLDGLHYFETLLRDFIHTERHCRRNSIILLHDCVPTDAHVARRLEEDGRYRAQTATPGHWAGDVWKTAAILKQTRKDLKFVAYDASPTGLIAITNLDPSSKLLEERYFELVADYAPRDLHDEADSYFSSLGFRSFDEASGLSEFSLEYWL